MTLAPQAHVGPYVVIRHLGSGGMGEVYRAKDTRLGREVALKVLSETLSCDADFVQRFEREARLLASLNHANIMVVHDVGHIAGLHYLVTELLEGETLSHRMGGGALGVRRAVEIAIQMAQGLAAAHERGVVHRDLKPSNVFLNKGGRVKLLDFGLAKALPEASGDPTQASALAEDTATLHTRAGALLGTAAYMAPEQVRGEPVDARTDIFAFGIVLFEMLMGRRPFEGDSAVETMTAILKAEPPDLALSQAALLPALGRVVRHCLEKAPEARFQSARDLVFDLEAISFLSAPQMTLEARIRSRLGRWAGGAAVALGALGAGMLWAWAWRGTARPVFHQQTYRQGTVTAARFADGGRNLLFSAVWEGAAPDTFSARAGSPEFRPLGLRGSQILAVSPRGEAALLTRYTHVGRHVRWGVLATMPMGGGAPRELADHVAEADWSPDGASLAVVRFPEGASRIEYPLGTVRLASPGAPWYSHLRLSPDGRKLAYIHHPISTDDRGTVAILELSSGRTRLLGPEWSTIRGLAWAPGGRRLWTAACARGVARALQEIDLRGNVRERLQIPGTCAVMDVDASGRLLMADEQVRETTHVLGPRDEAPRDLSWLNYSLLDELSPDGATLLFREGGASAGPDYDLYFRATSGDPAVKIGVASTPALSPDKRWVLATQGHPEARVVLLPTGSGDFRILDLPPLQGHPRFLWLPDGQGFLMLLRSDGQARLYIQGLHDRQLNPLPMPEGWIPTSRLCPKGRYLVVLRKDTRLPALWDLENQSLPPQPLQGIDPAKDDILTWDEEGRHLFVLHSGEELLQVDRVAVDSGRRESWRSARLGPLAARLVPPILLARDGKTLAFRTGTYRSSLYIVEGL